MADAFSELKAELTLDQSGLDRGVSKAESSLGNLSTAMAGAGVGAAALGGAIIGKSIQAFGSFDQALTQSTAIMGDVSSAMKDKLGKTARDTAAQLGISSDKAAESYYFLASAGLDASESMEAMPAVAQFAAAGQIDMAEATDYATDVMKAFQIPTKNMTRVTDAMTASVTRHNSTMEGMGEAMSYVAPVAKGLGLSVEETSAAIGFLGDAGIKGSKAGTTLRQALAKLSNPTKGMQKKLKELGVSVTGSGGKMRNFSDILADLKSAGATTADVMELFGTRAGPGMQVLLSEGGKAIAKEAKKIKSMGGITKEVAEKQLQTLNKQVDIFKTKLQNAAISIGGYFAPGLTRILKLAGGVVDWFSKLNEKTDGLAGAMSAASLVVGGLALAVGTLVGGPLVGLVAGVAGVAGVVGTMTGRFDGAIASIKSVASSLSSLFAPAVKTAMRAARAAVSGNLTKFASLARKAFGQFQTAVKTGLGRAWSWVKTEGVAAAKGAVTALGSQAVAAFSFSKKNILPKVRTAITSAWTWVTSSGVRIGKNALKGLGTAAIAAFTFTKEKILPPIQRAVKAGWNWIKTSGVSLGKTALGKLGTAALTAFKFTKKNILPKVKTAIKAGWTWLRTKGLELGKKALGALVTGALAGWTWTRENVVPPVKTGLSKAWTWLKNDGVSLAKGALSALVTGALKGWTWTRENVVPPLKTGFGKAWSWAKSDGVTAGKKAVGFLGTQAIAAFSFSKKNILPKVKTAIKAGWTWVTSSGVRIGKSALKGLGTAAIAAFTFTKAKILPKVSAGIEGVARWVRGPGATQTASAFGTLATRAKTALRTGVANLPKPLRGALSGLTQLWKYTGAQWVRSITNTSGLITRTVRRLGVVLKQLFGGFKRNLGTLTAFWKAHGRQIEIVVGGILTVVSEIFRHLFTFLRTVTSTGLDVVFGLWKAFGPSLISVVNFLSATILGVIGGLLDGIFGAVKVGMALIDGRWSDAWNVIVDGTKSFLTNIIHYVGRWGGALLRAIGGALDAVIGAFVDFAYAIIGGSIIPDMFSAILHATTRFIGKIVGFFGDLVSRGVAKFDELRTQATSEMADLANGVISRATELERKTVGRFGAMKDAVLGKLSDLKRNALAKIGGLLSEAKRKVTGWVSKFTKPFKNATDKINGFFAGLKRKVVGNSHVPDMLDATVREANGSWARRFVAPFKNAADKVADRFAHLRKQASKMTGSVKKHVTKAAKHLTGGRGDVMAHANKRYRLLVKTGEFGPGVDFGGLKGAYFSKVPRSLQGSAFDFVGEALDEHGKAAGMRAINWLSKHPNAKTYPYGKFARGGIVRGPTNALIGEAGPEAVIPLSKLDSMVTPAGGGSKEVHHHHHETTVIKLDGDKTAELWRGEAVEVADEKFDELQRDIEARRTK